MAERIYIIKRPNIDMEMKCMGLIVLKTPQNYPSVNLNKLNLIFMSLLLNSVQRLLQNTSKGPNLIY